jgi:tRNA pseudouridine13 synthase
MEPTSDLPFAFGGPPARGAIRVTPEDFVVDEVTGISPTGAGEHAWLRIRKRDANTQWVAQRLAAFAGVRAAAIGYAGLKDRRALTTQTFTVHLAGRPDPDWSALECPGIEVLEVTRHQRKLQRGALRGNRFRLTIRGLDGDRATLAQRLGLVSARGVPNYFGPQRFGRDGANLAAAAELLQGGVLKDRFRRGMAISAARALLFNAVLAERVANGTWDAALPGDLVQLDGRHAMFRVESAAVAEVESRAGALAIHPTGPLPGRSGGSLEPGPAVRVLEEAWLAPHRPWVEGLTRLGVEAERRALRLPVRELGWALRGDSLELTFELSAGGFATTVLRECVALSAPADETA